MDPFPGTLRETAWTHDNSKKKELTHGISTFVTAATTGGGGDGALSSFLAEATGGTVTGVGGTIVACA
jgi:hypothetical protein